MFSGIITDVATVKKSQKKGSSLVLTIEMPRAWKLKAGDSIATDGTCLTVAHVNGREYTAELMAQTLQTTTFGKTIPTKVNLERPLTLSMSLDGHIVQGHVDTVGEIIKIVSRKESALYRFSIPKKYSKYVVEKGSISVGGVALTVVQEGAGWCTVALVDYTLAHTTLGDKKVGDLVNIEFDIIGKYVEKLLKHAKR